MMNNRLFQHIGLAMRAGKVITGEELLIDAVHKNVIKLLLLANDASDKSKWKWFDKCADYNVQWVQIGTAEQYGDSIGKGPRVAVGITDSGFAKLILKSIANCTEVDHID